MLSCSLDDSCVKLIKNCYDVIEHNRFISLLKFQGILQIFLLSFFLCSFFSVSLLEQTSLPVCCGRLFSITLFLSLFSRLSSFRNRLYGRHSFVPFFLSFLPENCKKKETPTLQPDKLFLFLFFWVSACLSLFCITGLNFSFCLLFFSLSFLFSISFSLTWE